MRCVECQPEPLAVAHFCECCGREVTARGTGIVEVPSAPLCGGCGGPAVGGDLCPSCQQAFGPLLDRATLAAPAEAVEADPAEAVRAEAARAEAIIAEARREEAIRAEAIRAEAIKAEAIRTAAIKAEAERETRAFEEAARRERIRARGPRPAVSHAPIVPVRPRRQSRSMVWAATAAVILCLISVPLGARWLGIRWPLETSLVEQPEALMPPETPARPESPVEVRTPLAAPKRATTAARPKRATTAARPAAVVRAAVEAARPASQPVVAEAPAPVAPPPVTPAVREAALRSAAPAAPAGRLFGQTDVDEPPRVATRVAPRLPPDLAGRSLDEIVVVRVLVSQSGHPSRVSLLRRSKAGPSLDDAVVAAVAQWTFAPAQKRGEAVSCWYNMGVPVGRAD